MSAALPPGARVHVQRRGGVDFLVIGLFGGIGLLAFVWALYKVGLGTPDERSNAVPALVVGPLFVGIAFVLEGMQRRHLAVALDGPRVWGRTPRAGGATVVWYGPVDLREVTAVVPVATERQGSGPALFAVSAVAGLTAVVTEALVDRRAVTRYANYSLMLVGRPVDRADARRWCRLGPEVAQPDPVRHGVAVPVWDPFRGPLAEAPEVLVQLAPTLLASGAVMAPEVRAALEAAVRTGGDPQRFVEVAAPIVSLVRCAV